MAIRLVSGKQVPTVVIRWQQTNLQDLSKQADAHLYILSRGGNLLYIGLAYKQSVSAEARKTINDFSESPHGLVLWLGRIDREESDFQRVTEELVNDVECLLIYTHQPPYNMQCKADYTGRPNLRVRSRRCSLLRPCVEVIDGKPYKSCR